MAVSMEAKKGLVRDTEECKVGAVRQVTERAHPLAQVADQLEVSVHRLYSWMKRSGTSPQNRTRRGRHGRSLCSVCLRLQGYAAWHRSAWPGRVCA